MPTGCQGLLKAPCAPHACQALRLRRISASTQHGIVGTEMAAVGEALQTSAFHFAPVPPPVPAPIATCGGADEGHRVNPPHCGQPHSVSHRRRFRAGAMPRCFPGVHLPLLKLIGTFYLRKNEFLKLKYRLLLW